MSQNNVSCRSVNNVYNDKNTKINGEMCGYRGEYLFKFLIL